MLTLNIFWDYYCLHDLLYNFYCTSGLDCLWWQPTADNAVENSRNREKYGPYTPESQGNGHRESAIFHFFSAWHEKHAIQQTAQTLIFLNMKTIVFIQHTKYITICTIKIQLTPYLQPCKQNLLNFRHHFLFGISSKISSF